MADKAVISLNEFKEHRLLADMYYIGYGKRLTAIEFLELGNEDQVNSVLDKETSQEAHKLCDHSGHNLF